MTGRTGGCRSVAWMLPMAFLVFLCGCCELLGDCDEPSPSATATVAPPATATAAPSTSPEPTASGTPVPTETPSVTRMFRGTSYREPGGARIGECAFSVSGKGLVTGYVAMWWACSDSDGAQWETTFPHEFSTELNDQNRFSWEFVDEGGLGYAHYRRVYTVDGWVGETDADGEWTASTTASDHYMQSSCAGNGKWDAAIE